MPPADQAQINRDAWNKVLALGLAGVGTGAGLRGLIGLRNLFSQPPAVDSGSSLPTSLPVYVEDDEEDALRKAGALLKQAFENPLTKLVGDSRPGVNWWQIPVGIGMGAGGAYGGWKLIDKTAG